MDYECAIKKFTYLSNMRRILTLHVGSRITHSLLLGIVGVISPRFRTVWSSTWRSTKCLWCLCSCWYWPRWKLLMSRSILDRLEGGRISHWRCWWWRLFISCRRRLIMKIRIGWRGVVISQITCCLLLRVGRRTRWYHCMKRYRRFVRLHKEIVAISVASEINEKEILLAT